IEHVQRDLQLLALILLVPIVPFLVFHEAVERWVALWIESPPGPAWIAALVVGLLSTDVLLPIPSSLVSTLAGGHLPPLTAALTSWLGLNLGAACGFWLSRTWGRPLAERLAARDELERTERLADRYA